MWEPEALEALRAIIRRGNRFSQGAGTRMGGRLRDPAKSAAERPFLGRKVPEFDLERMRERVVEPYRLIYLVLADRVEVISIVHGARDLTEGDQTDNG